LFFPLINHQITCHVPDLLPGTAVYRYTGISVHHTVANKGMPFGIDFLRAALALKSLKPRTPRKIPPPQTSVGPTSVRVRDIRFKMSIQPITNHQSPPFRPSKVDASDTKTCRKHIQNLRAGYKTLPPLRTVRLGCTGGSLTLSRLTSS
jgi:hypothetical protein